MSGLTCKQAENLFDAQLNGELRGSLATELGAHLLRCPTCRHELALMEVAGHVIRSETDAARVSVDFTDRLMACIERPLVVPFYRRPRLWIGAGSALAAAACLLFAFTFRPGRAERVLGVQETRDGALRDAGTGRAIERPSADIGVATETLVRRLQVGASRTQDAVNSIGQVGKQTLLETIHAIRPAEAHSGGLPSVHGRDGSALPGETAPDPGSDEEIEDL